MVNRFRQYALLTAAIDLVQWTSHRHISHVHGHSCANSAHVLPLARRLGGPSYSLTLHGALDVYGGDQGSKEKDTPFVCRVCRQFGFHIQGKTNSAYAIVTCSGGNIHELA